MTEWLEYDWQSRKKHAVSLLKKVRLGVVPADSLKKVIDAGKLSEITECKELLSWFLNPEGAAADQGASLMFGSHNMFCSRGTITVRSKKLHGQQLSN